jgi:CPA2 family monovalent cation:H+ antiporter-2
MLEIGDLMFQVGIILLIAFIGAALAMRFRQSVILGYILAGLLIGPFIRLDIGGFRYEGLIQDVEFVQQLAFIGLILLLFFIGLEFSVERLRRAKSPAFILAVTNLGINMFAGFAIGAYLGWPLLDTLFLAGVVSMTSAAVIAKTLIEMKRLKSEETQFLLGMIIVQDFLSMLLLTVAGGLMTKSNESTLTLTYLLAGVIVFILFFMFLALYVIPRIAQQFERIKNEELFILFTLGIVFVSAAMAEAFGVPAIIGAFFIGMVFADTKLVDRFTAKLESFRDAFVAIFFVSFGMMIDPAMFPLVVNILILAVPLVILNDLILTSILAFSIGFSGKASVSMGTALMGRGAESLMFASVGANAKGATRGAELYPFAGAFCFVMSAITPTFMKRAHGMAAWFSRHLPEFAQFGGRLVRRTLKAIVMPARLPLTRREGNLVGILVLFFVAIIGSIITGGVLHWVFVGVSFLAVGFLWGLLEANFHHPTRHANYAGLELNMGDRRLIRDFVMLIVIGTFASAALVAAVWQYYWQVTVMILVGYLVVALWAMKRIHGRLVHEQREAVPFIASVAGRFKAPDKDSWKGRSRVYRRK